jgi:hypothetical protein
MMKLAKQFRDIYSDEVARWERHVEAYEDIKAHLVLPRLLGTEGIDFIAGHLDILDRKLGSLLTFHGLFATVVGLYLNVFFLSGRVGKLSWWFWAFASVWMGTTLLCVYAMARFPWGNLADKPRTQAKEKQIHTLVKAVVIRTALFRLAVPLTFLWLILFAVAASRSGNHSETARRQSPPTPPVVVSPEHTELLITVGPFSSGVGCSALKILGDDIDKAVSGIQRIKPTRVRIIGFADAQSLRPNLVKEFGDNRGLAITRARCVAGWLTQALSPRIIQWELTSHDAVDQSRTAIKNGNPLDRNVQVRAIP